MDIIGIPGIRYKGRELSMEQLGLEGKKPLGEDIEAALEIRELLLSSKETTIDDGVGFRWLKGKNGWGYDGTGLMPQEG